MGWSSSGVKYRAAYAGNIQLSKTHVFSLSEYSKDGSFQHKPEASVDKNAIKLLTKTENSFLVGALTRTAGKIL